MNSKEQVQAILSEAGLTLASVNDLPADVIMRNGAVEAPFTEWHVSVAKGIAQAAKALIGMSPLLANTYNLLTKHGRIVFAELTQSRNAAMSFVESPWSSKVFFLVNTLDEQKRVLESPRTELGSFAALKAKDFLDRTGVMDTAVQYLMKMVMWHELGHFLDSMTNSQLSYYVQNSLVHNRSDDIVANLTWLQSAVSNYAAVGGPQEATAELFAMFMETGTVPTEFDALAPFLFGSGERLAA